MMRETTAPETLAEEEERVEGLDGSGSDMSRIIGMSDAMFAFSMTFLVVTLVLPQVGVHQKYPDLGTYLANVWPNLVAYFISFFVIASWWAAHRRLFSPIVRYDTWLVRINNLFLLVIAITPFMVGILYEYGPGSSLSPSTQSSIFAVQLFAVMQILGGLLLFGVWRHSTRNHRLVEPKLPMSWIQETERAQLFNVGVFATSIPIALLSPLGAMLVWIVMAVGGRYLQPRRRRRVRSSTGF